MKSSKGTWGVRLLIHALTVALGVLVFWLLGFVLGDIASVEGPDYASVEAKYVGPEMRNTQEELDRQIADLDRQLGSAREQQDIVSASSQNLQGTINQMLQIQRLSIEKQVAQSEADKSTLAASQASFLEYQTKFQELNQQISVLATQKQKLEQEKSDLDRSIVEKLEPAQREYEDLWEAHRFKLGAYQLALLVPVLLIAGSLLMKRRGSAYWPLFFAVSGGTLLRVVLVIHEYFPSPYFKYIITIALIIVVARLLIHVIRLVMHPKREALLKQYREAYERFLCPVCEFPIRTGPRRWLYWTRRTVHKVFLQPGAGDAQEAYTCPACGMALFAPCGECGKVRHAMLPHCAHCGALTDPVKGEGTTGNTV
ncbi:MAG: hypothetical protein FJY92_08095 [Candidatus Hydrogenedentes bacterium]|nr:hypothetical protein [Candidatus Hydrogenedentota bacterium]